MPEAEGLQKMVTSFVNKDKEQRGKTNSLKKSADITSNGKVKKSSFSPVPDQSLQSPKKVAAASSASSSVSKPAQPDVNLNYDISLDLDVNNLSSQQTQNLLMIKELLQQQQKESSPSTVGKKRQNSKASTTTSNMSNSAGSNKLTASEQPTKKQSKASSGSSRNGPIAVSLDVVDGRMGNTLAVSDKGGEPAATTRKSSKTKENSGDSKPATKEKPTGVATVVRKSTSRIATDNAAGNTPAAATSATSAASATPAATSATSAPSMDATPATSASTTMPTLNKVKPTSGARAALTNGQDKSNIFVPESLRFPI